jgi:hypothetical protein
VPSLGKQSGEIARPHDRERQRTAPSHPIHRERAQISERISKQRRQRAEHPDHRDNEDNRRNLQDSATSVHRRNVSTGHAARRTI